MSDEQLTESEAQELVRQLEAEKLTLPAFFGKVIENKETTRTGNLNQEELGISSLPVRSYKELELFCRNICEDDSWADYFKEMSEIQTSTSLSKDAILLRLVTTKRSEVADVTKPRKQNKSWFKKEEKEPI